MSLLLLDRMDLCEGWRLSGSDAREARLDGRGLSFLASSSGSGGIGGGSGTGCEGCSFVSVASVTPASLWSVSILSFGFSIAVNSVACSAYWAAMREMGVEIL